MRKKNISRKGLDKTSSRSKIEIIGPGKMPITVNPAAITPLHASAIARAKALTAGMTVTDDDIEDCYLAESVLERIRLEFHKTFVQIFKDKSSAYYDEITP